MNEDKRAPDIRAWALGALFALTAGIFLMIFIKPEITTNTLFVSLATAVIAGGGLLGALGFYFGTSQSSAKKDDALAAAATQNIPPEGK